MPPRSPEFHDPCYRSPFHRGGTNQVSGGPAMNQSLSNEPDSGIFRGARRRFQPDEVQLALQRMKRAAQRYGRNLWHHGGNLWRRGTRNPRALALVGAGIVVTLIGAYTVSASGVGLSLCPAAQRSTPASKTQKKPDFQ